MARDFEYEQSHVGYDCQYPEGGIQCKNYIVCDSVLPMWWFECKACYLCTICDMKFGRTLKISDHVECPICLETKTCVSPPNCDHSVCIDCFKRCYYGDLMLEGDPPFPYSDIEKEYYDDPDDPKWDDYPLIQVYHEECKKWDDARIEKYANEEHLRKCPLCRK